MSFVCSATMRSNMSSWMEWKGFYLLLNLHDSLRSHLTRGNSQVRKYMQDAYIDCKMRVYVFWVNWFTISLCRYVTQCSNVTVRSCLLEVQGKKKIDFPHSVLFCFQIWLPSSIQKLDFLFLLVQDIDLQQKSATIIYFTYVITIELDNTNN